MTALVSALAPYRRFPASQYPAEMRAIDRWIVWRPIGGKKIPVGPDGRALKDWKSHPLSFEQARAIAAEWEDAELGFLHGDGPGGGGIDMDSCRDPKTGEIDPRALTVIERCQAHTRVSYSLEGLKIFGQTPSGIWLELNFRDPDKVTVARKPPLYFALGGRALPGYLDATIDLSATIDMLVGFFGQGADSPHRPGDRRLPERVERGEQNDTLFREGCRHRAAGKSEDEIFGIFQAIKRRFVPVPSDKELRETARSCCRYEQGAEQTIKPEDFYAYMPMHNYLHVPSSGAPWPAASVDGRIPPIDIGEDANGKKRMMKASRWLDVHRPVEQMTWWPGKPQLIKDVVFDGGALLPHRGTGVFNSYRPPRVPHGDPTQATRWLDLLHRLYPAEAEHILAWLAHRVQRPHEKVNHALVLGGAQGIGKDTLLDPVRVAVGEWNFSEVSPAAVMGRFNGFLRAVVLRVNEVRDTGEVSRFDFYEHMKSYIAAPPEILRCDEKHLREYEVPNLVGVVMTTNHRTNGIYLPPNDRRHFVAWSEEVRACFDERFWTDIYAWLDSGGRGHVAALLAQHDLSRFDPKAPPPKTEAFWAIADANMAPEDDEMATGIRLLGSPQALVISDIRSHKNVDEKFREWLSDRRNAKQVAHRLETAGYVAVRNESTKAGRWMVGGKDCMVYAKADLALRDRVSAAQRLVEDRGKPGPFVGGDV